MKVISRKFCKVMDMLIGMDWLEQHRVVLNCFDKTFTCINNEGEIVTVTGIPRKTTIRQITALQLKRDVWKGCKAFVVTVINEEHTNNEDKLKLEYIPILRGYSDVESRRNSGTASEKGVRIHY